MDPNKYQIITEKIGLTTQQATMVLSLTEKHHIWVANQILKNPSLINCDKDFELILNWKKEDNVHNLKKLSFNKALTLARKHFSNDGFLESENSLNNKRVYLDLGKYKWVEIRTKKRLR